MERLTKRDGNFVTVGKKPRGFLRSTEYCKSAFECPNVSDRTCPYLKMIDRLAAYEDTGLSPEEIIELKGQNGGAREVKRLTNTLKSGSWGIRGDVDDAVLRLVTIEDILGDEYDLDRLRDLVQADREGRCVVLNMPRKPLVWGDDNQNTCLCPYCGKDLMGIPYGERMVLQCPECGQYLDVTKIITRAEAEAALREDTDEH